MKKKARVAPKNIQFKDSVQIKEIPRDDVEVYNPNRRESWIPQLNEEDLYEEKPTKQRNIILGIVLCGCILLVAVIGTIVGVVFGEKTSITADQSLTYNEVCQVDSNQCMSSQGLYCSNGFCSCSSPYSWNTNSQTCTLLTYNQVCSTSNQCNSSLGLNCTNKICNCDNYHSWNSINNICEIILNNTLNYNDTCVIESAQCNSTLGLTCTGNCSCITPKVWNISSCICPIGTFLNSSNLCETTYTYNHPCVIGSNQCDITTGLSCNNSTCQCDVTKYWNTNYLTCLLRVNYSDSCTLDSDCIPTLICPTIPGVCNCSQYLPDYVCNCPDTAYYDPMILQCVNRSTFNGSCISSANYTCLLSLYCNAGICNCPSGTTWVSANSICA